LFRHHQYQRAQTDQLSSRSVRNHGRSTTHNVRHHSPRRRGMPALALYARRRCFGRQVSAAAAAAATSRAVFVYDASTRQVVSYVNDQRTSSSSSSSNGSSWRVLLRVTATQHIDRPPPHCARYSCRCVSLLSSSVVALSLKTEPRIKMEDNKLQFPAEYTCHNGHS